MGAQSDRRLCAQALAKSGPQTGLRGRCGHVGAADHFLGSRFGRFLPPLGTNPAGEATTLFEEEGYGLAGADGLGGAAGGEKASELANPRLFGLLFRTPGWDIRNTENAAERVMKRM